MTDCDEPVKTAASERSRRAALYVPLACLAPLLFFLFKAFDQSPRHELPSPLIDKPLPEFELESLADGRVYTRNDLLGEPFLLNVFGSWCQACYVEHPLLNELNAEGIKIVGLNYKDTRPRASAFLTELGNPYSTVLFDPEGELGIELGVYGAPSTYLVDATGVIRVKQVGVLTHAVWETRYKRLFQSSTD